MNFGIKSFNGAIGFGAWRIPHKVLISSERIGHERFNVTMAPTIQTLVTKLDSENFSLIILSGSLPFMLCFIASAVKGGVGMLQNGLIGDLSYAGEYFPVWRGGQDSTMEGI